MPKPEGRLELEFTTGFYQSRSLPLSNQQCVNWFVNINEAAALSRENLFGTPGISLVDEGDPLEANRGSHTMAGIPYFVNGGSLYQLIRTVKPDGSEEFTLNQYGPIAGTNRVSMADNGSQLCIVVPGDKAYIFTASTGTLAEITDPDFDGPCNNVVFVDGYFAFAKTDSKKWFVSAINDGLSYNALDFTSAERDPDNLVALAVSNNQVHAFGTESIEIYQNVGGAGFPFQRTARAPDKGLRSIFSIADAEGTLVFLGQGRSEEPRVYSLTGVQPVAVSTEAVDSILQDLSIEELDSAFAWYHGQNGAHFWGITAGLKTLVFDATATRLSGRKVWHERSSLVEGASVRWRPNSLTQAYNRVLCGDYVDGRIGVVDDDVFTEYGTEIVRTMSTRPFYNLGVSVTASNVEAVMDTGTSQTNAEPLVGLDWSDDGGRTWVNKLFRSLGPIGDYGRRIIWRRLGRFPSQRVLRLHFSEDVRANILKLMANSRSGQ